MEEKFIDFMINNGLSENSYKSYANDIKIFMNYYYDSYGEELHTLIRGDVLMYISFLVKNNYSPTSINRKISALKKYNLFLIQEKIQNNIVINEKDYIKIQNTMKPLYRDFCNNLLNNYREICKIENLHPHMLRTFFCSNALHNAGYSIEQVANQAGHSSLNTTRRYLVSGQEKLISLADKL